MDGVDEGLGDVVCDTDTLCEAVSDCDAEPVALAVLDDEEDPLCDGDIEPLPVASWDTVAERDGVIVNDPDTD